MKIAPDTNVLVRALVEDDSVQSPLAQAALADAELVAFTMPMLCELVWVLSRSYRLSKADIAGAIRILTDAANAVVDDAMLQVGLAALDAGHDFADAVIAEEGYRLGAETFVSFDKGAVGQVEASGGAARRLV